MAWNTANLTGAAWVGEMPKLETLLKSTGPKQAMSTNQQRAALSILSERYGIPLRKTHLKRRERN